MDRLEAGRLDNVLERIVEHCDRQTGQDDGQEIFGRTHAVGAGKDIENLSQIDRVDEEVDYTAPDPAPAAAAVAVAVAVG